MISLLLVGLRQQMSNLKFSVCAFRCLFHYSIKQMNMDPGAALGLAQTVWKILFFGLDLSMMLNRPTGKAAQMET